MHNIVIVESPAKAKTVEKYLGSGYRVFASFGHVRDLPSKNGSINTENKFEMLWSETENARKSMPPILQAATLAKKVFLATDPDREGEAISWHVREVLKEHLGENFNKIDVARITFHEITKNAILKALEQARAQLDENLVDAYRTRRALDYLVGFSISPLLWRKLPGARSAGRVQSVALRMVCERQAEIEVFKSKEFWTIEMQAVAEKGQMLAKLIQFENKKLTKLAIDSEQLAEKIKAKLRAGKYSVAAVTPSRSQRHPAPPFITSSLQQEASNKLGFSPARTMRTAQKLYEGLQIKGSPTALITYMRTDSLAMSSQAIAQARAAIAGTFGNKYLPDAPRFYKTKARNAQEAHEAIRPINFAYTPQEVEPFIDKDHSRLYALIWRRAIASQMVSAVIAKQAIDIVGNGELETTKLRAVSSRIEFDGFLKIYRDSSSDEDDNDVEGDTLPPLKVGEKITPAKVDANRHETQPPPHFSEARLIRELEQAGIGRPSTYAAIINVLKTRGYVALENRKMIPQDAGRMATSFLRHNFTKYIDYKFTANLEEELDKIACGEGDWRKALQEFWSEFKVKLEQGAALEPEKVREQLDNDLAYYYFPTQEDGSQASRVCPTCKQGRLEIHPGRHGAFIGCSIYPDCRYTRGLADGSAQDESISGLILPHTLGTCPETSLPVLLCRGPYGLYLQRGETSDKKSSKKKPKRAAIPKQFNLKTITLESACELLSLPREVGSHPQTAKIVKAGLGRFGPFLLHDGAYSGLGEQDDVMTIGINRAVVVIAEGGSDGKKLGNHNKSGKPIIVKKGRFGFYLKHDGINASLPRSIDPEEVSIDEAIDILDKKIAKNNKTAKTKTIVKAKAKVKKTTKVKKSTLVKKSTKTKKTTSVKKALVKKTSKTAATKTAKKASENST